MYEVACYTSQNYFYYEKLSLQIDQCKTSFFFLDTRQVWTAWRGNVLHVSLARQPQKYVFFCDEMCHISQGIFKVFLFNLVIYKAFSAADL